MSVKNDILSIHDPRVVLDKEMNSLMGTFFLSIVVVACIDNENIGVK